MKLTEIEIKKVKDLVAGLEALEKNNEGLPVKFQ